MRISIIVALIVVIIVGLFSAISCTSLDAGKVLQRFDVKINSVSPLISNNSEFVVFEFNIKPPSNVQPNLRYFVELYSFDGKFFDNGSVVWSKEELMMPDKIGADERDIRKIRAYELAMTNYPPNKSIKLKVPYNDKVVYKFWLEYDLTKVQDMFTLDYIYGDLNKIFYKYFKITIKS